MKNGVAVMERDYPLLIFGNTVNELMLAVPAAAHARGLASVTPRKMWLAQEGDVLVTPRPVEQKFKEYVCSVLNMRPELITTISPGGEFSELLAHGVRRANLVDEIRRLIAQRPGIRLLPFATDRPTVALAQELNLPLEHYGGIPGPEVVDRIYELNTKSGFRREAERLGLRTVPGAYCDNTGSLADAVTSFTKAGGAVIVKLDRSSNGYGHTIIRKGDFNGNLRSYLQERLRPLQAQPQEFTVEMFLNFHSVPSIELVVDESGPRLLYPCDQRCHNNSFTGMVTPPEGLPQDASEELSRAGWRFAAALHEAGIRGVCDVDGGITADGTLFVTETNLRRTGGTYLDALVRRLLGQDYLRTHVWVADSRMGAAGADFFRGWSSVVNAGLAFDRRRGSGALATANTIELDGKWRYLIVAPDLSSANEIERGLERTLELQPLQ
jgi:hypothetical protein